VECYLSSRDGRHLCESVATTQPVYCPAPNYMSRLGWNTVRRFIFVLTPCEHHRISHELGSTFTRVRVAVAGAKLGCHGQPSTSARFRANHAATAPRSVFSYDDRRTHSQYTIGWPSPRQATWHARIAACRLRRVVQNSAGVLTVAQLLEMYDGWVELPQPQPFARTARHLIDG
jgi:hypothetical protein